MAITGISLYVVSLVMFSTILNFLSVVVLIKKIKTELAIRHVLLVSLAVSDICTGLFGFPLEMFRMSEQSCVAAAYLVTLFSLVSITHMCALAVERCLSISKPFLSIRLSEKRLSFVVILSVCWLYGASWATFPVFGWGSYAYESKTNRRCSIEISSRDSTIMSYNFMLLVFCYVIPIAVMVVSLMIARRAMTGMVNRIKTSTGKNSKQSAHTAKQERSFTLVVLVMLASFVTAWTPYAICVFMASIHVDIPPVTLDVSAYLGKSSIIHNPIIYVFLYKQFRLGLVKVLLTCFRIDPSTLMPLQSTNNNSVQNVSHNESNTGTNVV